MPIRLIINLIIFIALVLFNLSLLYNSITLIPLHQANQFRFIANSIFFWARLSSTPIMLGKWQKWADKTKTSNLIGQIKVINHYPEDGAVTINDNLAHKKYVN